jgi:hypothetical protein
MENQAGKISTKLECSPALQVTNTPGASRTPGSWAIGEGRVQPATKKFKVGPLQRLFSRISEIQP